MLCGSAQTRSVLGSMSSIDVCGCASKLPASSTIPPTAAKKMHKNIEQRVRMSLPRYLLISSAGKWPSFRVAAFGLIALNG
jgi:hypothetical protein